LFDIIFSRQQSKSSSFFAFDQIVHPQMQITDLEL
jgi:hypothetical protein